MAAIGQRFPMQLPPPSRFSLPLILFTAAVLSPSVYAAAPPPACMVLANNAAPEDLLRAPALALPPDFAEVPALLPAPPSQLIVIGFMGGNVNARNLIHREATLARNLQQRNPHAVYAEVFANGNARAALNAVLLRLNTSHDGCLSDAERHAARIIIYGHSWGASETVTLARRLNQLHIPVLLTIQVDSVQKLNENDAAIPPNVREAINFFQQEGMLHGRPSIAAADPKQTTILGNFESSYKTHPVSVAEFPWYARAFMKTHIEIENDPVLWARIEALIQTKIQ